MAQILGIVFRCKDRTKTGAFYKVIGCELEEHQHGEGPLHFGVKPWADEGGVLELYASSGNFSRDALMVRVFSLEPTLDQLRDLGIVPRTERRDVPGMSFIYVTDPDGRDVMLIEEEP
jgi:hypothetical protein